MPGYADSARPRCSLRFTPPHGRRAGNIALSRREVERLHANFLLQGCGRYMLGLVAGLDVVHLLGLLILSLVIGPYVICCVSPNNIHDNPYDHEKPEENDGLETQQQTEEAVANGRVPAHWTFAVGIGLYEVGPDNVATEGIVLG